MAFNRILGFQPVRATRPCQFTPASFVGKKEYRNLRDPGHIAKCPDYPDPQCYLSFTQEYFFRNVALRQLRVEQFKSLPGDVWGGRSCTEWNRRHRGGGGR